MAHRGTFALENGVEIMSGDFNAKRKSMAMNLSEK
jgi:hypothetical protein